MLYAAMAAFWALGGAGFPYGDGDPEAADMGSLLVGATAAGAAMPIAATCAVAALLAPAMARRRDGILPRRLVLAAGWGFTALMVLAIPDVVSPASVRRSPFREVAVVSTAAPRRPQGTTNERADRPRADCCFPPEVFTPPTDRRLCAPR